MEFSADGKDEVDGEDGGDGPGPGFEAAEGWNDILLVPWRMKTIA